MAEDIPSDEAPFFADGVLKSLDGAVSDALGGDVDALRDKARGAIDALANEIVGQVRDGKIDDPCKTASQDNDPTIPNACLTRDLALKTNTRNEDRATSTARSALGIARDTWTAARDDYQHNIESAAATMKVSLAAATATQKGKVNPDSRSRNQVLFYSMKSSAAAAVEAFQATAQTEAATLAAAAGALLSAYSVYVAAVEAAHAVKLAADATTYHDFWATIEGVFDAP